MTESRVGKVTIVRDVFPRDYHVSIRGTGTSTLVVAGEKREIGGEHPLAGPLLATLHELVKHEFPYSELLDAGPGPGELNASVLQLKEACDRATEAYQARAVEIAERDQRIAEADAANAMLTLELEDQKTANQILEAQISELRTALGLIEEKAHS